MLNIEEVVKSTNANLINGQKDIIPQNYVLDSRDIEEGDFFIPIVGEKVDSHKYIIDCVKKQIVGYFINSNFENKDEVIKESIKLNPDICILEVENAQNALYDAGLYNREKHINIPVVAITGSVGKTSTREMIASVLREEKNVLVTQKNYNSCIGIPIMLLKLENQDICVLEAGIDSFGEMELESKLLKPDIAVMTNIGVSHMATFGNKETTLSEKIQITNYIKGIKKLVVNSDDKLLKEIKSNEKYDVVDFNIDIVESIFQDENKISFETKINGKTEIAEINQIGNHNVYNALCAIKVAEILGYKTSSIIDGIAKYQNFARRLEKKYIRDNILIIDDTYNASIDSMKSGLITVNNLTAERKIAVLGDMFDLGETSARIHETLSEIFEILNYDIIYTLGNDSENISKGASKYVTVTKHFEDREELIKEINSNIKKGDVIYFKASNGMKFDEIVERIK